MNDKPGPSRAETVVNLPPSEWPEWLAADHRAQPRRFASSVPVVQRVLLRSESAPCERLDTDCWLYRGSLDDAGYSCLRIKQKNDRGHRITWEALHGPVPPELHLDHLCRVHSCVNPEHLEPITPGVNTYDRAFWASGFPKTTHCPLGHEMTEANTYYRPSGKGRMCRDCVVRRTEASEKIRKAEVAARRAAKPERPHGDAVKYSHEGCRCDECRAAATAYGRERRRLRREASK